MRSACEWLIAVALAAACVLATPASEACDRPMMPTATVVAAADSVTLGEVAEVRGEGEVVVRPLQALKGSLAGPFVVSGVHTARKSRFEPCQAVVVEKGGRYVFAAWSPEPGTSVHRIVDPDDGVVMPDALAPLKKDLALEGGHSAPARHESLRFRLVADKRRYSANEDVTLTILVDHLGAEPVKLTSMTWPPEKHSFCELRITRGRETVAARPVPIPRRDIVDYFSKHGNNYEAMLRPQSRHRMFLQRINSAKPGWGYKEDLGFVYYPLGPGDYEISAVCRRFFPKPVETRSLRLTILP